MKVAKNIKSVTNNSNSISFSKTKIINSSRITMIKNKNNSQVTNLISIRSS